MYVDLNSCPSFVRPIQCTLTNRLAIFSPQLSGVSLRVAWCPRGTGGVWLRPQPGPPALSPVVQEFPPGSATTTASASWWRWLVSVRSAHAPSHPTHSWRYASIHYMVIFQMLLSKITSTVILSIMWESNRQEQCWYHRDETQACPVHQYFVLILFLFSSHQHKCNRIAKASRPVTLTYAGCSSVKKFHSRYCGSCLDGRCCTPQQTQTVAVRFRCEDGDTFSKDVMVIESCSCDFNCSHNNEKLSGLSNGIRKSRDWGEGLGFHTLYEH